MYFEEEREMKNYDIVIIGGGPAGLAAAIAARKNGTESILILLCSVATTIRVFLFRTSSTGLSVLGLTL